MSSKVGLRGGEWRSERVYNYTLRPFVKSCCFFNTVRPIIIMVYLDEVDMTLCVRCNYLQNIYAHTCMVGRAGRPYRPRAHVISESWGRGRRGNYAEIALLLIPLLLSLLPVRIVSFLNPES